MTSEPEFWMFATQSVITIVGAAVTIFTLIYNNRKRTNAQTTTILADNEAKTVDVVQHVQTAGRKVDKVETIVNGERSQLVARVTSLEAENAILRVKLEDLRP